MVSDGPAAGRVEREAVVLVEPELTLDNAHAELLALLRAADGDLEHGYYATEREDHAATGERVFGLILVQLDRE